MVNIQLETFLTMGVGMVTSLSLLKLRRNFGGKSKVLLKIALLAHPLFLTFFMREVDFQFLLDLGSNLEFLIICHNLAHASRTIDLFFLSSPGFEGLTEL